MMLKGRNIYSFAFSMIFVLFTLIAFFESVMLNKNQVSLKQDNFEEKGKHIYNSGKFNILSETDVIPGVVDTVYTKLDCWLELKIHEQKVYQHWRDGRTEVFPVSTGNPYGGPESLESRPGLFAIFMKVEHHKSSQFNSANMYHFMPFNQGIGFHSIDGTGYYAHLGVRPSSHGCIRMKHQDAKKLFSDCPLGTLVLATRGKSSRTVAFAPKDYENETEYTADDFRWMLAKNLKNLLTGNYFVEKREKFVLDPGMIPKSGIYTGYDVKQTPKQSVPRAFAKFTERPDKLEIALSKVRLESDVMYASNTTGFSDFEEESKDEDISAAYDSDVIKKYFSNPIGVLPYFGPKK